MSTYYEAVCFFGFKFASEDLARSFLTKHNTDANTDDFNSDYYDFQLVLAYCEHSDYWYLGYVLEPGVCDSEVREHWENRFLHEMEIEPKSMIFVNSY